MGKFCPECGIMGPATEKFCEACGAELEEDSKNAPPKERKKGKKKS